MEIRSAVLRVLVAALCAWALAANVADFGAVRIRVIQAPLPPAAVVTLPIGAAEAIPNRRLVFVCRLRNLSDAPVAIEVRHEKDSLARVLIAPHDVRRLDVTWDKQAFSPGNTLDLVGTHSEWTVESAELANLHGFSRGLLNFFILPAAQPVERPPLWVMTLVTVGTLLLLNITAGLLPRWLRRGRLMLLALLGALFFAAVMSPMFTPYRIVLAPRTFALGLFVLLSPSLFALTGRLRLGPSTARIARPLAVVACGAAAVCFYGSAMVQTLAEYDGNYSGFLHVTTAYATGAPFLAERPDLVRTLRLSESGYDGQFMYLMTFDPFLQRFRDNPARYRDVVDFPPYRYGRIGFSVLTKIASGDSPDQYPSTMIWLALLAHFGIGALLAAVARQHGISPAAGLLYLAIPGFMSSLLFALPESLAALGLIAGLWCWQRGSVIGTVLCFGASLLIRETGLILVVVVLVASAIERRSLRPALALGAAALPLIVWRLYVATRLFGDFGWTAAFPNPDLTGMPFAGLRDLVTAALAGSHVRSEIPAALSFPIVLGGAAAISVVSFWRTRKPLAAAALAYGFLAVSLTYSKVWSHLPSGERATYELFLSLLLLFLSDQGRDPWLRRVFIAFFGVLAVYTLALSPEAYASRAALLLVR